MEFPISSPQSPCRRHPAFQGPDWLSGVNESLFKFSYTLTPPGLKAGAVVSLFALAL